MYNNDDSQPSMSRYSDNATTSSSFTSIVGAIVVGAVIAFGVHSIVTTAADVLENNYGNTTANSSMHSTNNQNEETNIRNNSSRGGTKK